MQITPLCFLFFCLHLKWFLYSTQTKASLNTPLHTGQKTIWSSVGWKKHPCPPPTSTEVLSHLRGSVHKCSTLAFFTTLTRTWQKIFCCVNSELGTRPSGEHTSVIPATFLQNNPKNKEKIQMWTSEQLQLIHAPLCHNCTLRFLFFFFFWNNHTCKQSALAWKKWLWKLQEFSCMWISTHSPTGVSRKEFPRLRAVSCKHHGIYLTSTKHFPLPQTYRKL